MTTVPTCNGLGRFPTHAAGLCEGHKWLNLAVSRFISSEATKRAFAIENHDLVARKMTRAQIAEAHKLAREWKSN